jgi:hypothetical protein
VYTLQVGGVSVPPQETVPAMQISWIEGFCKTLRLASAA